MDFFDKHSWFGPTLGVFIGFLLTRLWDAFTKPAKKLGFYIQGKAVIRGLDKEGLEVTYHGEPVQRLDFYRIVFRNTGNIPLEKVPIAITASGPLRGKLSYKGPDGGIEREIQAPDAENAVQEFSFEMDDRKLNFERSLLNPKEEFFVEFLVANGSGMLPEVLVRAPGLTCTDMPEVQTSEIVRLLVRESLRQAYSPGYPFVYIENSRNNEKG